MISWWVMCAMSLALCRAMVLAVDPPMTTTNPYKLQAAYLLNFAQYVQWPSNAFPTPQSPWQIGILGNDPFGDVLEATFKNRKKKDRPFEIRRARTIEQLPECNIVFVAIKDADLRKTTLSSLKGKPVLTVGASPDFITEGGIIRWWIDEEKLLMQIDNDQARASGLGIDPVLLKLPVVVEVINEGKPHKNR